MTENVRVNFSLCRANTIGAEQQGGNELLYSSSASLFSSPPLHCDHDHFDDDHLLDVQHARNDHLPPHCDNLLANLELALS